MGELCEIHQNMLPPNLISIADLALICYYTRIYLAYTYIHACSRSAKGLANETRLCKLRKIET